MKLKQLNVKITYENHHNGNLEHSEYSYIFKKQINNERFIILNYNGEFEEFSLSTQFYGYEIEIEIKEEIDKKLIQRSKNDIKSAITTCKKRIKKLEKNRAILVK